MNRLKLEQMGSSASVAVMNRIIKLSSENIGAIKVSYQPHYASLKTSGRVFCRLRPNKQAATCYINIVLDPALSQGFIQDSKATMLEMKSLDAKRTSMWLSEHTLEEHFTLIFGFLSAAEDWSRS